MVNLNTTSCPVATLKGSFSISSVPADVPYKDIFKHETVILEANNLVVNTASTAIIQLLRGNADDYMPAYITIGSGGDLNQLTKVDMGSRVAANMADTAVRRPVARIPIVLSEDGDTSNSWYYVAVARPHEALAPILNELGVETRNGTLMSHYVSDADASGRATKYVKTSLEYLIIRWRYELTLLINGVAPVAPNLEGLFVPFTLANGTVIYVLLAEPLAGAATSVALSLQLSDGSYGTVDIQNNGTITSQSSDETPATITLEELA